MSKLAAYSMLFYLLLVSFLFCIVLIILSLLAALTASSFFFFFFFINSSNATSPSPRYISKALTYIKKKTWSRPYAIYFLRLHAKQGQDEKHHGPRIKTTKKKKNSPVSCCYHTFLPKIPKTLTARHCIIYVP